MMTRGKFWRVYIPLALLQFFLSVLSPLLVWNIWACLSWSLLLFATLLIYSKVLKRLRDTGHTWRTALLLLVPVFNLYPIYLLYFKRGGNHPPKSNSKKFIATATLVCFLTTTSLFPVPARADWEWPKFEWPKIEWPRIEWPKIQIPGTNIIVDIGEGLPGINRALEELNRLADKIGIPGTSFSIYPKKNVEENIVLNIKPLLGDLVNILDPAKPFAQLARDIIGLGRPYIEQYIKPLIPPEFRNFLNDVLGVINTLKGFLNIPIIGPVVDMLWDMIVGPIDDVGIDLIEIFAEPYNPDLIPPGGAELPPGVAPPPPGSAPPGPPPPPPPPPNLPPEGQLENIDANGVFSGWSRDPDEPNMRLPVRLKAEDWTEVVIAKEFRSDGNPGFSGAIPKKLRDGKKHPLYAYALDSKEDTLHELKGSPKTFQLELKKAGGALTSFEEGIAKGWAFDPDVQGPSEIRFYIRKANEGDYQKKLVGTAWNDGPDSTFTFPLPNFESYRDGLWRYLWATIVDKEPDAGIVRIIETPLPPIKTFVLPKKYTVTFEKDPILVPQGGKVMPKALGVPWLGHHLTIRIGDAVALKTYVEFDDKAKGTTRTLESSFSVPDNVPIGSYLIGYEGFLEHQVYENFTYKGSFTLQVAQDGQLQAVAPEELRTEQTAEILISGIPSYLSFTDEGANVAVERVVLETDSGLIYLNETSVEKRGEGSVVIRLPIPYEAGRLVRGKGPAKITMDLQAKDGISQAGLNTDRWKTIHLLTPKGKDPFLVALCKGPSRPFSFWAEENHMLGEGFGCHEPLAVKVMAVSRGKSFDPVAEGLATLPATGSDWEGKADFYVDVKIVAMRDRYPDVREVVIEASDGERKGNAKFAWEIESRLTVLPLEGISALLPGGGMRIRWNQYSPGARTQLQMDGVGFKKFYLEAPSGATSGTIDDFSIPSDIKPGEHTLTMLQWDADKKEFSNGASTTFEVTIPQALEVPPPPSQVSPPSDSETKLPPQEEVVKPKTCPDGFEWSGYFKQCIEIGREEGSPFEGKPCHPSIPKYQQRGCVEE